MRYLVLILLLSSCAYKQEKADLVIHNAKIYVCNNNFDIQQAMAVKDGKIVEVGAERQIMNKYRADSFIDNQGKPVYPLFIDQNNFIQAYTRLNSELKDTESSRKEVLLMLTLWKAIEQYVDDKSGSLEKGKSADFFITNLDIIEADERLFDEIRITKTFRNGKAE